MAIVGSAYVEIHTITKGISDEIRDGLAKAIRGEGSKTGKTYGEEFGDTSSKEITQATEKITDSVSKSWTVAGTDAGKGFASKFTALLNPISKTVITPTVDTSRVENDIARVEARLEALRTAKTSSTVDLEIAAAEAKLRTYESRLEDLRTKPTSTKVEAEIASAMSNIAQVTARLARLNQEKTNPKVDLDIRDAEARLAALNSRLTTMRETRTEIQVGFNQGDFTDTINNIALLGRSLAALALPAAVIAATPQIASLGAAAVTAAGSLYLIPAAATAATTGVTVLALGFTGLNDALGPTGTPAQIKKVNEALANMAPAGREVVGVLRELGKGWHDVRLDVQQALLSDLGGTINQVGTEYMPILNDSLTTVAASFNNAAKEYGAFLLEPKTVTDYATGMGFVETALNNLSGVVEPLARAFNDMFVVGATYLPGYAQNLADLAERFAVFTDAARYSGEMNTAIEEGVAVLGQLGDIAGSSGGILKSVFDASTESGANIVGVTAQLTQVVDDFLNTGEGNAALVAIFKAINDVVYALTPAILALAGAIAQGIIALGPEIGPLSKAFADMAISVAPLITDLAKLATLILPPLTAVLSTIAPLIGPIVAGLLAMMVVSKLSTAYTVASAAVTSFAIAQLGLVPAMAAAAGPLGLLRAGVLALNAAFWANPITLTVLAIAGLVAALIYAYNHVEGFRNVVDAAFGFVVDVVTSVVNFFTGPFKDGVVSAVTTVIDFFVNFPTHISNAIASLGSLIATSASAAWNWLVTTAQDAGTNVLSFLAGLPNQIAYALGSLAGFLVRAAIDGWAGFVTGITNAVTATIVFFTELPGRIVAGLSQLGAFLAKSAVDGGNAFREGIVNAFIATVAFFTALPGNIASFLTGLGATLLSAAVTGWAGFTSGIESGWQNTVAFFVNLPQNIQNFFTNAGTWLTTVGQNILDGLIGGLVSGATAVGDFFTGLVDSFLQGFRDALGIASPSTVFAQFGTWILEGLINGLNAMISGVVAVIQGVGNAILSAFQVALDFIGTLWSTFWNGLNAITGGAFAGIQAIIEYAFQIIMVVVQAFIALFQGDWDGFWIRIKAAVTASLNLIQTIFSAAWNAISTVATTVWNFIADFFSGAFSAFGSFFSSTWNNISAVFSVVWNAISTVATTVWNFISGFFVTAFNFYVSLFTTTWNNVSTIFSTVWAAIQNVATTVWNAISAFFTGAFNAFTSFFQGVWDNIVAIFTLAWERNRDFAIMVWNAIAAFFTAAFNTFTSFFQGVWNNIVSFFTTTWNNIRTMVTTAWNNIQSFFTGALSSFKSSWDSFWSGISTGFQSIWNGIRSIAESAWQGINNMFRGGINLVIDAVNWPINAINGALGISIPTIPRLATGGTTDREGISGRVKGIGSTTNDRVLTRLSREEHVWSAAEVRAAGGHDAVRRMRAQVMSGYTPDVAPGHLSGAMAAANVRADSLGGRSVAEGLRRRQLMDRYPNLDGAGRAMLAYGGVRPHVAAAGDAVVRALGPMPGGIGGVGSRPNKSDHPAGLALDFMTLGNVGLGDRVAGMLQAQSKEFAVKYLIWQQAINSGGGWEAMEDRGSATANHMDHVHASFLADPGAGKAFGGGGLFDPGALFDAAAAALGLPEAGRNFTRSIMPDSPNWLEPMGLSFFDKGWSGMRATAIKFLEQISTLGGLLGGSPGATGPVADQVRSVAAQYGWDSGPEWDALSAIIQKESSWNPAAANPTSSARGLFQKMTSLHGPVEPTAGGQAQWGLNYIQNRYGTPSAALAYHNRVGSYDRGGWLKPGITQAINGTGKPEAIIADPMTTFERSFKNIFKWFTPEVVDGIENAWKGAGNWLRGLIDRYTPRETPSTESPTIPPVMLPPVVIPPIELPPVVAPSLPTGDFGATFNDVLSRLAPELSFAIQSGNAGQIDQFARAVANNPERISAISAAMTEALGTPVTNIGEVLGELIASVNKPAPIVPTIPAPGGPDAETPTDNRWLTSQFERFRTAIMGKTRVGSDAGQELKAIPALAADLYRMFPALKAATESSKIDVNKTLASMSTELLAYLSTKSQEDASKILAALSGDNAGNFSREGNTVRTTDMILKSAQDIATPPPAPAPTTPAVNIADGAFQVTIAGNADQVTLDQLQQKLDEFGEEIVRQYEGRT